MFKFIKIFLFGSQMKRINLYLAMVNYAQVREFKRLKLLLLRKISRDFGVYIGAQALIGKMVSFPHPVGVVIGDGVVIEDNVRIYQGVTLGGARVGDYQANRYPFVGSGTVIFSGAKVLGDVKIGRNCTIAANAVVIKNVPDNCLAVGMPARNVERKIREND